ncbi:MAG: PAS domain-containing sensor histidine kinase [Chloroflexia bacterium]
MAHSEAEHKHVRDMLSRNDTRLLAVWEHSADAMSLSDSEGVVLAANLAYYQLYGYSAEQVIGECFAIIFSPEEQASVVERYKQIFQSVDDVYAFETVVRRADGTVRIVESRIGFIQEDGRRTAMLSIIRDITERVRLEEERDELLARERQARADAEEAVRSRDLFLSVVSHDLKNPLAIIKGNTQLLQRHIKNSTVPRIERLNDGLSRIDETVNRMNLVLDDLMDFAGVQSGQQLSLQRKVVDLVGLMRRIVVDRQGTTELHQIRFIANQGRLTGVWDANRLERVVENILSNAIKYSPQGGEIEVSVSQVEGISGRRAVITVRDKGLGISAEDLPYIFEWFRRAGNVSGKISGAGIGLASARHTVEQHGGTIEVESEVGEGSTFTITLPLNAPGP